MAAQLKEPEHQEWSHSVSHAGLIKLKKAIETPKQPTEALKRLLRSDDEKAKK